MRKRHFPAPCDNCGGKYFKTKIKDVQFQCRRCGAFYATSMDAPVPDLPYENKNGRWYSGLEINHA